MRRIATWLLGTASALVLLFSYHTSTNASQETRVVAQGDSDSGPTPGRTVAGDAVSTRYGDVQVEITVENGTITASRVTQVPWSDHRDQEINAVAVPVLNEEAVAAQSADIDMVSGATYTSEGYIASLQSAIDRANL